MKQKKRSTINISDIRLIHRFLQHNDKHSNQLKRPNNLNIYINDDIQIEAH